MDKVISSLATRIINYFVCNGFISEDKKSVYIYSSIISIESALNIIVTLIIGLSFGLFFENLCFFIVFKILRKFSGGLHSSKFSACFLISVISNVVLMLIIKYFESNPNFTLILCAELISFIILSILAPVENANKPISKKEFIVYKLVVIVFAILLLCLSFFLVKYSSNYIFSIGMAMLLCSAFLVTEKIRSCFAG